LQLPVHRAVRPQGRCRHRDRKSTRLNSSHDQISYAVFCLKKKKMVSKSEVRANEHNDALAQPEWANTIPKCRVRVMMIFLELVHLDYDNLFFFFNDTATTEIYTLSLHDALPIWVRRGVRIATLVLMGLCTTLVAHRSEEHTSELQSRSDLVCRLLLEKKKKT